MAGDSLTVVASSTACMGCGRTPGQRHKQGCMEGQHKVVQLLGEFEPTSRSYAVEVEMAAFIALLNAESYTNKTAEEIDAFEALVTKLEKLDGVTDVEYDGHFGANIFFTLDTEKDNAAYRKVIRKVIVRHLHDCQKLKPKRVPRARGKRARTG